jgi:hypothetical protein
VIIIWRGLGFLVPVIAFGGFLASALIVGVAMQDRQYYQRHSWPKLVAAFVAAGLVWCLGRYLNRSPADRTLVDPNTGEQVVLKSGTRHAFFFMPMEYWGPIIAVLGIVLLFV